ncbi:hypothetical protein MTR67_027506 [Solanum verrucosum]|uniref:spermidine synthase n=1 Tax=Solanum verrucosum TaxID=315347 RepID=A0AAF0R9A0_SOLVR|nr:hypothetical protein MTR67_027506 [Solanum verrucosum]
MNRDEPVPEYRYQIMVPFRSVPCTGSMYPIPSRILPDRNGPEWYRNGPKWYRYNPFRCPALIVAFLVCMFSSSYPVSRKYLPEIAKGYEDPRATLYIEDGNAFVKNAAPGTYDVTIVDCSDRYEAASKALRPGGVYRTQGESAWIFLDFIKKLVENCNKLFKDSVNYAWTNVPSFPSGAIGFVICSTEGPPLDFINPVNKVDVDIISTNSESPLKYYNSKVHAAAFALPTFAEKVLYPKK